MGLTQAQLAEQVGVEPQHLSLVERGKSNITLSLLAALARALQIPPAQLLRAARLAPPKVGRPRRRGPAPRSPPG